jgi:hypothetical protein
MGLWFWFRVGEIHLRDPDGAADGAVPDGLAPQFGVYTGDELVAVRRTERGRSVGYGKELRLRDREW